MVEEVVVEQEEEGVEVVLVQHFVVNDFYSYYFHLDDLMIEFHHRVVVVEKNYLEMMNDYYKMIVHNVMAWNHNDEVHEKHY